MNARLLHRLLVIVACAAVTSLRATAQGDQARCTAALLAKFRNVAPDTTRNQCVSLAVFLLEKYQSRAVLSAERVRAAAEQVAPRDLQTRAATQPATAGAPNQGDAVPSVQPIAVAAGSLAAVGTGGGNSSIAALTLNPSILFGTPPDMDDAAKRHRVLDLTVLVPAGTMDKNGDGNIDYFGLRARVNFVALAPATQGALQRAEQQYGVAQLALQQGSDSLAKLLVRSADVTACASAFANDVVDVKAERAACGGAIDVLVDTAAVKAFGKALAAFRDSADAKFFGLDLRLDRGDPTLGTVAGASGTSIFAGLAAGKKVSASGYSLKARLGVAHEVRDDKTLPDSLRVGTSIDGAAALEFAYPAEFQPLKASAGIEFRRGHVPSAAQQALQTDYAAWRMSIDVPISASNSISVSYATPASGKGKPMLSVSANWQVLLSALAGSR